MSHAHNHDPTVPRGALIGAAAMLAVTLALTGATSFGLIPQSADPDALRAERHVHAAAERELRFADRSDGAVIVTDAASGAQVAVVEPGQGGFIRATVRRLAKARTAAGAGPQTPFRLVRWSNGALSLSDPVTGKSAELYGFGPDHVRSFAEMLEGPSA